MTFFDGLQQPAPFDPSAPAYKDWLHLNMLDHSSGTVGIFNVSLHGSPADVRSRAVGTALIHSREEGWAGNLEVRAISESMIGPRFIGLPRMGLAVAQSPPTVTASVVNMDGLASVSVVATALSSPVYIDLPMPFGSGWISWNVIPLLRLQGNMNVGGVSRNLGNAPAYHDHNWGRWHWGDDIGWEWGCFMAGDGSAAFVFARTTDRAHVRPGSSWFSMHTQDMRRRFPAATVESEMGFVPTQPVRRFPGALAALHQDRAEVALPATVRITGTDSSDHLEVTFRTTSAAQLITADPIVPGYGFIHELPGEFTVSGEVRGRTLKYSGLGIFEYVC